MLRLPSLIALGAVVSALSALVAVLPAQAQDTLNIYSARHYQTDEALYNDFTKQTGIKINRLDGKEDELLERIKNEGASSPADVLITVDAARLELADKAGVFQPLTSALIDARIPAALRTPNWAAFSTRARVIVYAKATVNPEWVHTYEDLAAPRLKNQICVRSGAHPYNLSLGAAMLSHHGEAKTEEWVRGLVANFARAPKGGDTDQLRAVAAGECGVAISNSCGVATHQILQPINPNGSSVFKQRSSVPAKFRVCDAAGNSIGTPGVVASFNLVQIVNGTAAQDVNEPVDSTSASTVFRFDPSDQQWIFVINTRNLNANSTYTYRIGLDDGTEILFSFGLK